MLIDTAQGHVKQKNVARDPRVAIPVVDSTNPYTMVTVRGKVAEQTAEEADRHIDLVAKSILAWAGTRLRCPAKSGYSCG